MKQLRDLLKHEVADLCSAEKQILESLPKMIDKASDKKLKSSLETHLTKTEQHKEKIDEIWDRLQEEAGQESKGGLLAKLFGGPNNQKCKGMEGLISEGERLMKEDMTPDVRDAAIIAAAQKIEHYEICGYGTARAYARHLGLKQIEEMLTQILDEEYEADETLTELAVGRLNIEAMDVRERQGRRNRSNGSTRKAEDSKGVHASASLGRSVSRASKSKTRGKAPSVKSAKGSRGSNNSRKRG